MNEECYACGKPLPTQSDVKFTACNTAQVPNLGTVNFCSGFCLEHTAGLWNMPVDASSKSPSIDEMILKAHQVALIKFLDWTPSVNPEPEQMTKTLNFLREQVRVLEEKLGISGNFAESVFPGVSQP